MEGRVNTTSVLNKLASFLIWFRKTVRVIYLFFSGTLTTFASSPCMFPWWPSVPSNFSSVTLINCSVAALSATYLVSSLNHSTLRLMGIKVSPLSRVYPFKQPRCSLWYVTQSLLCSFHEEEGARSK